MISWVGIAALLLTACGSSKHPASSSSGNTSTTGSPSTAAASSHSSSCTSGALKASDQGVTPTTIKLGFVSVETGILTTYTKRIENIASSWTKYLNSQGGICGRHVVDVFESSTYDSPSAQTATCIKLADDDKVFAVVAFLSFDTEAGQSCLAIQHKIPLISWDPLTTDVYQHANGYLWLQQFDNDLMLQNMVKALTSHSYLTSSGRVGIMYQGTTQNASSVNSVMIPELKSEGINPVSVFQSAADTTSGTAQMPAAVLQFKQAHVNDVIFVSTIFIKQAFVHDAVKQNFLPQYFDSDVEDGCAPQLITFAQGYPAQAYNNAICVTSRFTGSSPANAASLWGENVNSPFAAKAEQVYIAGTGGGYDVPPQTKQETTFGFTAEDVAYINQQVGTGVELFAAAANKVGRDLTRASWAKAMGHLGQFTETSFTPYLNFTPTKWSGPSQIRVVQFHAAPSNGFPADSYQPLTGFFSAYFQ